MSAMEIHEQQDTDCHTEAGPTSFLPKDAIYCGDARHLLLKTQPEAVALSFWSPPYFVGKPYERDLSFDDWADLLRTVIKRHFPVIRPGGFMVINIADILCFPDENMPRIQASNVSHRRCPVTREDVLEVVAKHPTYNRYQIAELLGCSEQTVDRRLKHNNIRGGKKIVQTRVKLVGGMVEEWAMDAGFYLYDRRIWVKDPSWENSQWHTTSYRSIDETEYIFVFWKPGITTVDRNRLTRDEWSDWGSRGVWQIPSVRANDDHPAKFPVELASRVIRLFSAPEDLVLDPFVGSGTAAIAAIQTGRHFIGFDLMPEYVDLAIRNCERTLKKGGGNL